MININSLYSWRCHDLYQYFIHFLIIAIGSLAMITPWEETVTSQAGLDQRREVAWWPRRVSMPKDLMSFEDPYKIVPQFDS